MKRYALSPDNGLMYESERGAYCRHEEAAAIIAEKAAEIATLHKAGLFLAATSVSEWDNLHEQLRASNEQLDRYTRISESGLCLGDHLDCVVERDEAKALSEKHYLEHDQALVESICARLDNSIPHGEFCKFLVRNAWKEILEGE